MRVLHIGKFFPPHRGGMETFLRSLLAEQARQGMRVHALVHGSTRGFKTSQEGYLWGGQTLSVTRVARWFTLAFTPFSPDFARGIATRIARDQPEVLHLHLPNPSAFWCLLLPSARRIPWVIHWHSDVVASQHRLSLRLLSWLYRIPERWTLKHAAQIIATSPPYLQSSKALSPFHSKCSVVPLGIEECSPANGPAACSEHLEGHKDSAGLNVLAVGRLTYYKGFAYLLQALADAPNASLTLVGDGEEKDALLGIARTLELGERFTLISACDDEALQELYLDHDVFCLPSIERTEAFGVVLLEAMRAGLPCIVTDVPGSGMRWVVDNGNAGEIVPPADSLHLSDILQSLHADRDKLSALSRAARERLDQQFLIAGCSRLIAEIYERVTVKR